MSRDLPTAVLLSLVEAKPVMAATMGGITSAVVLGLGGNEAIVFGGSVALGVSLGDAILTGAGYATDVRSYLKGGFSTYLDPLDFVGAGLGVFLINLALGIRGRPLAVMTGTAAVAGGIAPKAASYIFGSFGSFQEMKPAKTGSAGAGGEILTA